MSLTVSEGEGLTVITITSNPKSKWPVLCQILGFLCNSPGCFAPQHMKGNLKDIHIALGILQLIVGVINIVVGTVLTCIGLYCSMSRICQGPSWLGGMVFLVAGIMCIRATRFTSSCLVVKDPELHKPLLEDDTAAPA